MKLITFISKERSQLWQLRLFSNSNWQVRKTLREICEAYQKGERFTPRDVNAFITTIKGLYDESRLGNAGKIDIEINRWVIKAIIEIGGRQDIDWLKRCSNNCADEENFVWLAIGLMKLAPDYDGISDAINRLPISAVQRNVAAIMAQKLQYIEVGTSVNIDNASRIELLIACIAFGLGRSVESLFNPKFSQIDQLTALNEHHDQIVMQYSVYAMWRMPSVGFGQCRIPLAGIGTQNVSVRRWMYELVLKERSGLKQNIDFWVDVAENEGSDEALEGFANGIFDYYIDGVPDINYMILSRNRTIRVQSAIIRHMIRNSHEDSSYYQLAVDEFSRAVPGSPERAAYMDAAIKRDIIQDFRTLQMQEEVPNLFHGGDVVMGDKISNYGNAQNISVGNNNKLSAFGGNQQLERVSPKIDDFERLLEQGGQTAIEASLKEDFNELRSKPSTGIIEKIIGKLKLISDGAGSAKAIVDAARPLIDALTNA